MAYEVERTTKSTVKDEIRNRHIICPICGKPLRIICLEAAALHMVREAE